MPSLSAAGRKQRNDDEGDLEEIEKERNQENEDINENEKTELPAGQARQQLLDPPVTVDPLECQ